MADIAQQIIDKLHWVGIPVCPYIDDNPTGNRCEGYPNASLCRFDDLSHSRACCGWFKNYFKIEIEKILNGD